MDNLSQSSKASKRHSSTPMKQRRSGYEPSDTETEWQDHHDRKNRTSMLIEADNMVFDLPRNISPLTLDRKVEYENGSPPRTSPLPRRHNSRSPYKTRRDDGRNVSPLSKSKHENRRHVSPYKPGREDHNLITEMGNGNTSGLFRKQSRRTPTREGRATIGKFLEAGKGSDYSFRPVTAPRQRGDRRTPSPISRSMVLKQRTVGEINEMVANAMLSRSPMYNARMFENKESISPGDILFSRDAGALPMQNNLLPNNGSFGSHVLSMPPMFKQKDSSSRQRMRANGNFDPKAQGFSSSAGLKLSTQNSKISDSSGRRSSVNSGKSTANRLKGQSETWFACVMRGGPCRNSKKSSEKQDFDEASFIGKATVVEKLRQFWADKYQPASLDGFTCHKQEAQLLKQLVSALPKSLLFLI